MLWRWAVLVVVPGCHLLFDLERVPPVDDEASCPVAEPGPPTGDPDEDLLPTSADNCPTQFNPRQADEDADGTGNACDLCPASDERLDADCDGIGDSCDPDNGRVDVREFIGFEVDETLELYGAATITDGALQVRPVDTLSFAFVAGPAMVQVEGRYETRFDLIQFAQNDYATFELRFGIRGLSPTAETGYFVWLLYTPNTLPVARLALGTVAIDSGDTAYTTLEELTITPPTAGTYSIRVDMTNGDAAVKWIAHPAPGEAQLLESIDYAGFAAPSTVGRFGFVSNYAELDAHYVSWVGPE